MNTAIAHVHLCMAEENLSHHVESDTVRVLVLLSMREESHRHVGVNIVNALVPLREAEENHSFSRAGAAL